MDTRTAGLRDGGARLLLTAESTTLVADLMVNYVVVRWTRVPVALEDRWALQKSKRLPLAWSKARRSWVLGLLLAVYKLQQQHQRRG